MEGSFARVFGASNASNTSVPSQPWYQVAGPFMAAGMYVLIALPVLVLSFLALWGVQAPDRFLKPKKA